MYKIKINFKISDWFHFPFNKEIPSLYINKFKIYFISQFIYRDNDRKNMGKCYVYDV